MATGALYGLSRTPPRTDAPVDTPDCHPWQGIVNEENAPPRRGRFLDTPDERGNVDHHRTPSTHASLACQASLRLEDCEVLGEPEVDLVEGSRPLVRSRVGISWRPMVRRSRFESGSPLTPSPADLARGRPFVFAVRAEAIG